MSTKPRSTPKRISSLKALEEMEELSSSKSSSKKRGHTSFVFEADEDGEDEEEEEDEDSSVSSVEEKQAAKPRKSLEGNTKKKAKPAEVRESRLFDSLRRPKVNGALLARDWVARCCENHEESLLEILSLFILASGGTVDQAKHHFEFKKSAGHTLDAMCRATQFASVTRNKTFANNFASFFYELGRSIRNQATERRDAIRFACDLGMAAAQCTLKNTIRVEGVSAGMNLGAGLLARAQECRLELAKSLLLFDSEALACEDSPKLRNKAKLSQARVAFATSFDALLKFSSSKASGGQQQQASSDLDPPAEECQEAMELWSERGAAALSEQARQLASELMKTARELRLCERWALEGADSVFQEIAQLRFRDTDALVRLECARQLGRWTEVAPAAMGTSHRSKYLGWLLHDKNAGVRQEALLGLVRHLEQDEFDPRVLGGFVSRFTPRVRAMLNDVEEGVASSAVTLCTKWAVNGLLDDAAAELVFDVEELLFLPGEIGEQAARFVATRDARLGLEETDEVVRIRAFLALLTTHLGDESQEDDVDSDFSTVVGDAMCAFASAGLVIGQVEALCELLQADAVNHPGVLAQMLHARLLLDKNSSAVASRVLPDLLIRWRSDEAVLCGLVRCVPLLRFVQQNHMEKVLRELQACSTERNLLPLLDASAQALGSLPPKQSLATVGKVCAAIRSQIFGDGDDVEDGLAKAQRMARCSALARHLVFALNAEDEQQLAQKITQAGELGAWLVFAIQTLVYAKKSNHNLLGQAFSHCFTLSANGRHGCLFDILRAFHDAHVSSSGWRPNATLTSKADSLFMDLVSALTPEGEAAGEVEGMALGLVRDQLFLPLCRNALFGTRWSDCRTPAYVLRFAHFAQLAEFRHLAGRTNAELRKADPIRWLMAHFECICLDTSYAESLLRLVGPSTAKTSAQLSKAVSIMVCQAIRVALQRSDDALLTAVAPYLAFCKESRSRAHVVQMWEKEVLPGIDAQGDESFGLVFQGALYGTTTSTAAKKRRSSTSSTATVRKRISSASAAASTEDDDPVDENEEEEKQKEKASQRKHTKKVNEVATVVKAATPQISQVSQEFEEDEDLEEEVVGFRPRVSWT